ncbi:hypothetical protein BGZ82_009539, partial [Podila clonocystis]
FSDEERRRIKAHFAAEAAKHEKPAEEEQDVVGGLELDQINILLIGDYRSGKTSLVETFRLYADPNYQAKTEHITQGNNRFADETVKITAFLANLHTVQIRKLRGTTGEYDVVDLEEEAKRSSEGDFEDLLNLGAKGAESVIIASNGTKKYRFNIFEGPSLNESVLEFEKNIFSIHKTLVESKAELHQVLFTLAPGPLIGDIKATIRVCSDVFSDFNPLFSFVHTKIDYPKLHIGNKQFHDYMKERTELLQSYIRSSAAPYMIDCNLQSNWPVQRAKTYNVVHDILKAAIDQTPMALKSPLMKKTPKMIAIDAELKWLARDTVRDSKREIGTNKNEVLELSNKIHQLDIDYNTRDHVVNSDRFNEDITVRDDMEIVFADEYKTAAEPDPKIISRSMTFGKQSRKVEKVQVVAENVEIEQALGGEGFNHWMIIYRRETGAAASLVVKLYARKQDSAGNPVGETRDMTETRQQREMLEVELDIAEGRSQHLSQIRKGYDILFKFISSKTLPNVVMEDLIRAKVYEAKVTPFDRIKLSYMHSGNVPDTNPSKSADDSSSRADEDDWLFAPRKRLLRASNLQTTKSFTSPASETSVEEGMSTSTSRQPPDVIGDRPESRHRYSVLVLGKIQSGKSTLIQHFKNYANPSLAIDHTLLGDNTFSKTQSCRTFVVETSMPSYEAFHRHTGEAIDLQCLDTKFKDDEDYHDFLLSSESEVGLRLISQNRDSPSMDLADFEFLDTPGICNHEGKDAANAENVIESIVSARAFNLVLVVINPHDPLTAEQLIGLQFYSDLLRALKCRCIIAFIFTHVDYSQSRLVNANLNTDLKKTTHSLARIFHGSMLDNNEPCPSFSIDLAQNKRPVIQSIIRSTLRNVLQLVVSSPAVLMDTSPEKVLRIKHMDHPSKYSGEQRRETLTRIYGKTRFPAKDPSSNPTTSSGVTLHDVNILVIGDARSGKSTLIEVMKMYSNLVLDPNVEPLGQSDTDADEILAGCRLITDLHTYKIHKSLEKQGENSAFNLQEMSHTLNQKDYEDHLLMDRGDISSQVVPPKAPRKYRICIFETPDLQEDVETGNMQEVIFSIYRALSESHRPIHQVLITLAPDSITSPTKQIIDDLFKMFPDIGSLFAFVHTKIDYRNLHCSNRQFHDSLEKIKEQIQGLIRTDPPIFFINSDPDPNRPVQLVCTLNTIHDVLLAAVNSQPKYSVLVLGKSQSGKSCLIQHIKKYADPNYQINRSLLGSGNFSKTESVSHFSVVSNLPTYEVLEIATNTTLDLKILDAESEDTDDYCDRLRGRESNYSVRAKPQVQDISPPERVEFRFLDTPGTNDTDQRDTDFARTIVSEIIATRSFNLILVVVSNNHPLTMEYGRALEYYANVLEGLHSNITFLYTHVDYADCHHSNTVHAAKIRKRHQSFSNIFRERRYVPQWQDSTTATTTSTTTTTITTATTVAAASDEAEVHRHFTIDLLDKRRPIIQCLIRNTIRDILHLAVTSPKAELDTSSRSIAQIWAIEHPDAANRLLRKQFGTEV